MKIAVPTRAYAVDDHFGHCEAYTIFTIDENKNIKSIESLPSPQGCGCKVTSPQFCNKKESPFCLPETWAMVL